MTNHQPRSTDDTATSGVAIGPRPFAPTSLQHWIGVISPASSALGPGDFALLSLLSGLSALALRLRFLVSERRR